MDTVKPDLVHNIGSLHPLPTSLRAGLTAVSVFGALSFTSSSLLAIYLFAKLISFYTIQRKGKKNKPPAPQTFITEGTGAVPPELGLIPPRPDDQKKPTADSQLTLPESHGGETDDHHCTGSPNQFFLLILNLLVADAQQAAAFLLNVRWVATNSIQVYTDTCWAQGWLVSTGDLSSSIFITMIAFHTYSSVVHNFRLPQRAFYLMIGAGWFVNYLFAILGVAITRNGRDVGGFYVRAASWCWINAHYEKIRLLLHYLWIFVGFAVTSTLYILTFIHIRCRRQRRLQQRNTHPSSSSAAAAAAVFPSTSSSQKAHTTSHEDYHSSPSTAHIHDDNNPSRENGNDDDGPIEASVSQNSKAFLVYPAIYIICTAPLALGRILSMAKVELTLGYFCFAGVMIASNGWLDVLLFSSTRRSIIFHADLDSAETGLDTFAFLHKPGRTIGNIVMIQGSARGPNTSAAGDHERPASATLQSGGWLLTVTHGVTNFFRRRRHHQDGEPNGSPGDDLFPHRCGSQEMLRRKVGHAAGGASGSDGVSGSRSAFGNGGSMDGGARGVLHGIQMETMTTVAVTHENPSEVHRHKEHGNTLETSSVDNDSILSINSLR